MGETESKKQGIGLVHTENATQPMHKTTLWSLAGISPAKDGKSNIPGKFLPMNTSIMEGSPRGKVPII